MIGMRIAAGLLATATLTTAAAYSSSHQPTHVEVAATVAASTGPSETFKPLLQQALPQVKGKTQLDDKPVTTYHQGENWVEQPGPHHVLTENASRTEPAKLLVVSVTKAKLKMDDQ